MQVDVKKYDFGIIGMGFLGSALSHGFGLHANSKIYDKYKDYDSLEDVVKGSKFIWMCLPTPMDMQTGAIDLSILEENLDQIHDMVDLWDQKIIIIKSTVIPGTTRKFAEKYPKLNFIMNPEFLTARNNRLDFICASRIIIGAEEKWAGDALHEAYSYRFGNSVPIYRTSWEKAELTIYGANNFFALKISYFNFMYRVCQKMDVDFDEVRDMILADGRIGRSHANVPGWDGKFGYSGACFPKDVNAFIRFAEDIDIDPRLLKASWEQNLEDRPDHDWEHVPSAVSNKEKTRGEQILEAKEKILKAIPDAIIMNKTLHEISNEEYGRLWDAMWFSCPPPLPPDATDEEINERLDAIDRRDVGLTGKIMMAFNEICGIDTNYTYEFPHKWSENVTSYDNKKVLDEIAGGLFKRCDRTPNYNTFVTKVDDDDGE